LHSVYFMQHCSNISTMKNTIKRISALFTDTFLSAPNTSIQFLIILVMGLLFIWIPQKPPIDWDLNTKSFWTNIHQVYLINHNLVYPPWGLILLIPYYLFHAEGTRVLSVILIGWLTHIKKWPFYKFFVIVLSPYFIWTMIKSNMDILVIVFPILIWECSKGKKWESPARGISLSILLLKPQCTFLLLIYLLWMSRKEWKKLLVQLGIAAIIIVPINFLGSPPLFLQWVNNIIYPSPQNQSYWSINNISLSARFGVLITVGILFFTILILILLTRTRVISWKVDQTISSLLLCSMFLSPYTSQQSLSSGLAFIPSWQAFLLQWIILGSGAIIFISYNNLLLISFFVSLLSVVLFSIRKHDHSLKTGK
jgi:hypothetical protein